jgi:hypothetical protein
MFLDSSMKVLSKFSSVSILITIIIKMKVLSKFSSVEDLHESIQFIFTSCDFGATSVRGLKLLVYEALSY